MTDKKQPIIKQELSVSPQLVESRIYLIRGQKVMLDSDLAELYEVETKALNQAVKRNVERFPHDFMFQLDKAEYEALRSQFVTLETGRGKHSKYLPYVFSEQGIAMLSSVLKSARAIQVNITIMRAFVRLRELTVTNEDLAKKFDELEKFTSTKIKQHDDKFKAVFDAIKRLIKATAQPLSPVPPPPLPTPTPPAEETPKRKAGFVSNNQKEEKK